MYKAWAVVVLLSLALWAQTSQPERTVSGQVLTSKSDPAVTLEVARGFEYAGAQVIDLYSVAEAELHYFIDAGKDRSIRRFYWIQFEHYYPSNQHTYDYSGIKQTPIKIGSLDFAADARIADRYFSSDTRAGSDSEATRRFLKEKGYKFDGTFARARMFHLAGSDRRKELMIIYGERVSEGKSEEAAKQAVMQHAREGLTIREKQP